MNHRSQTFDLRVEGPQIDEAVSSLFHTVLYFRTLGKFSFSGGSGSYSIGEVGWEDVDCNFVDVTYLCCTSSRLNDVIKGKISEFSGVLRRDNQGMGQISLEFFQRKKRSWPFQPESIPWEVWNIRIQLLRLSNERERQQEKERVEEELIDKMGHIGRVMNRNEYLPSVPPLPELELVFDTSFPDVQPYLFKLGYYTSNTVNTNAGYYVVKQMLKETLSF